MSAIIDADFTERTGQLVRTSGDNFLPSMSMHQAMNRYNSVLEFTQTIMKDGKDYGKIPGSDKPSLLKPGAEKLCSFFGLTPKMVIVEKEEDWTGADHGGECFFYYHYRVQLWKGDYLLGEGDGSCNSMESKYRYRWVQEDQVPIGLNKQSLKRRGGRISEPKFAVDKAETGGQYGKPMEHWQAFRDAISNGTATVINKPKKAGGTMEAWEIDSTLLRVPNPDIADQVNSIQKMAYKRALVAVVLIVCNASEYYTQDLEDMEFIDNGHAKPAEPKKEAPPPSNGNGAEKSIKDKEAWFRKQIPLASAVADPESRLVYLRDGMKKQGFDDSTLTEFATLWFETAIPIAKSDGKLKEYRDQIDAADSIPMDSYHNLISMIERKAQEFDAPIHVDTAAAGPASDPSGDIPF